ncbi:NADH dehydrogenase [ubiquinone] 1 alpha subcomplex assembly factor 4-like [Asterias amurensis]|uniref:NADH dehydrogenase [ubiquinone] 1 alpha subcomplex assembly factor 4-like n=1 Tax=Asterias amurensis TaxID=7602 RepID=UPI003AB28AF5
MGNALKSGVQRFNAENRAHKLLDKSSMRSAPRHPTTAKAIQELQTKNPEVLHEQQRKDDRLLGLLQNIRVDSTDPAQEKPPDTDQLQPSALRSTSRRSLPLNRAPIKPQTTFFEVPDEIPDGRLTVPMAIEMLAKHKRNPKEWPVDRLATDYKLDLKDAENILEYFNSFKVIAIQEGPSAHKPSITGGR